MASADREHIFVAPIQKIWIMRCVDVPRDVSVALRDAAGENVTHPPVHGLIEGLPFKSTLVPGGDGCFRLHVHSRIWRKLRIDAGAEVEVTLMLDQAPRPAVVPADLAAALAAKPTALKMFNALTLPLRRQLLWYVNAAKQASTREKRVKLMVQRMLERAATTKDKKKQTVMKKKSGARKSARKQIGEVGKQLGK
jgi:hypothetical protein